MLSKQENNLNIDLDSAEHLNDLTQAGRSHPLILVWVYCAEFATWLQFEGKVERVIANIRYCIYLRNSPHPLPNFEARLQNCDQRLLASLCLFVRLEQLCSNWADFDEIWYLSFLWKSVEEI
jgi:hypothetical protein